MYVHEYVYGENVSGCTIIIIKVGTVQWVKGHPPTPPPYNPEEAPALLRSLLHPGCFFSSGVDMNVSSRQVEHVP